MFFHQTTIMKRFIPIFFLSCMIALPVYAEEAPLKNAGFIPSNIWYSKEPFFAGEKIRVYTIIFNGSAADLEGSVQFFDNGVAFGKVPFSLPGGGRVRDIWIDYVAKEGNHVITARLIEVEITGAGGVKRAVVLENSEAGKSEKLIDLDTDGDAIGNREDLDDDNDGLSDIDEIKNNTNPLKSDSNGNGVSDGEELKIKISEASKAQTSNFEKTGTSTPEGTIGATLSTIDEAIPQSVKKNISTGANAVENFRLGQGYQFRLNKEAKEKELESISARQEAYNSLPEEKRAVTSGIDTFFGTLEKPFAYVMLWFFAVLQFIFEHMIIFYAIIAYLLYRLVRWIVSKPRFR